SIDKVVIDSSNIAVKDLRKIKVISDGDFYAPSKAFDKPYYARFGTINHLTSDIRGNIFPWGIIIMAIICAVIVGAFYVIRFLSKFEIKRIPLAIRILSMFLPVYVIAMGILVFINTSDAVSEYVSVLNSEQERGAKTVADNIDGNLFSNLDHVSGYMTSDYLKVKNSIEKGYSDLLLKIGDRSDYLITYKEKYNKLYATISTKYNTSSKSYDELKYTNPDMVTTQCVLVDSILERDETEALYSIWNKFSNKTNTTDSLEAEFRDVYGNMKGSFVAIKDTNGRVVGFVGNFLDSKIHSSGEFKRIFLHSLAIILIITVFVFAYICFVVKLALKPLKKIEGAITVMSKGEWNTRIRVDTKDELADIAQAFNIMSEKIDRYTSNLIRLNKEYIRYVPNEIFKFMGKEKINQVQLYDNTIVNMNAIYITFNLSCKGSYEFKDENEIFEALNKSYKEMFKVVEKNNGVVQSFDGLDAIILFPNSAQDAFKTAIQFKEIELNDIVKEHLNITLGAGDVLIGISGSEDRRGAVVVSDEIMQMFNIDTQIGIIGINMVATKTIIDALDKSEPYNYRFIGRVGNITGEGYTEIFEIIDASNKYKRDLYMSTKETFEKGVKEYILNNMETARSIFTDVLRVNENDKVAVYYLMKCEEHMGRLGSKSSLKKGFNGYII
ncbi:MAG: HAMP domain-containing protein, partial [Clostridia bacterium]|nr:HAMP domain-containing protein [Clostridia bacterium]